MHPFEALVVPPDGVGIHWFGQSSFALKHPDGTILQVDPYYPHDRPADTFIHREPPLDEASMHTDFVLLTHNHGDHTCVETIGRIVAAHPQVELIGPPESSAEVSAAGIAAAKFTTVTAADTVSGGPMTVHVVWSKPPQGVRQENIDPPDCQHLGLVVDTGSVSVYISGDPINSFADHESLLAPIRALKPHIGLLTNHPTEGEFPFFAGSVKMSVQLELKAAVPAHYNCFVARNYDPQQWAAQFPKHGPDTLIIAYNESIIYTA